MNLFCNKNQFSAGAFARLQLFVLYITQHGAVGVRHLARQLGEVASGSGSQLNVTALCVLVNIAASLCAAKGFRVTQGLQLPCIYKWVDAFTGNESFGCCFCCCDCCCCCSNVSGSWAGNNRTPSLLVLAPMCVIEITWDSNQGPVIPTKGIEVDIGKVPGA